MFHTIPLQEEGGAPYLMSTEVPETGMQDVKAEGKQIEGNKATSDKARKGARGTC